MTKVDLAEMFGTLADAAIAMSCLPSSIYRLPDTLPIQWADRAIGAKVRQEWRETLRGVPARQRRALTRHIAPATRKALGLE